MFEPGNDHLELLFEFGLGRGDGGPWKARLGDALDTPEQMVRGDLGWAITHGMTERVRLFVEHGVDIVSPFGDGVTPAERAAVTGHPELVRYLVAHGAHAPDLGPEQRFVAAALVADQAAVAGLRAAHRAEKHVAQPFLLAELTGQLDRLRRKVHPQGAPACSGAGGLTGGLAGAAADVEHAISGCHPGRRAEALVVRADFVVQQGGVDDAVLASGLTGVDPFGRAGHRSSPGFPG